MNKLDGNERWKSKMLLTEHVEQYDQQHAPRQAKVTTAEERTMIRDYILLPHMEKMVQKSLSEIESMTTLLKRGYLMTGHRVLQQIMNDQYALRRELKMRNIRIVAEEQSDAVVYHRYYCRGYEEHFGMTREVMRSEISWKLSRYVSELGELLKGAKGMDNSGSSRPK